MSGLRGVARGRYPLLLVAPAFLVLFLLTIYPFGYMLWISLHQWPILPTLPRPFVGVSTYAYIFADEEFWNSVRVTAIYMAASVSASLASMSREYATTSAANIALRRRSTGPSLGGQGS